jgi:hypothetical protein
LAEAAEGGLAQFRFGQYRQFETGKYCFPLSAGASISSQRIGRLELFLNGRKSSHRPLADVPSTSRLDNCPPTGFVIGNDSYCEAPWAIVAIFDLLNDHPVQINAGNALLGHNCLSDCDRNRLFGIELPLWNFDRLAAKHPPANQSKVARRAR